MEPEGNPAPNPPEPRPPIWGRIGPALGYATWGYVLGLVLLLAGMEWIGEKNWVLSFCLYLPVQLWLLPLVLLIPLAARFRPRLCVVQGFCVVLVLGVFSDVRLWPRTIPASPGSLVVVTNNIGQSNHQSMQPFVAVERPDLLALQDAANRGPAYSREYPDRFVVGRGEFILVSKYPVLTASLVQEATWKTRPVAARFELSFKGGPLVVYNVHMPTPRSDFFRLSGLGWARELLGRNQARSDGRSFGESMRARVELAEKLAEVFRKETQPFIVVGDFNAPDHGRVYGLMASFLKDAFDQSGRGYGYTFPGVSGRALTLLGPWLRLDYLFAGNGWEPAYARVEPHRLSQHRAVAARFEPKL